MTDWAGNYFPGLEDTISSTDTGDGTEYPIEWDLTLLSTATDQITRFEVGTGEVTWDFSADITLEFPDPMGGSPASDTQTLAFTQIISSAATTMSDLFPNDWVLHGGQVFDVQQTKNVNFTLPWGTESVTFTCRTRVKDLYLITGSTTRYTKKCEIVIFGGSGSGSLMASTNKNSDLVGSLSYQPLSTSSGTANVFHSTSTFYSGTDNPSGAISVITNDLTVSAALPGPL